MRRLAKTSPAPGPRSRLAVPFLARSLIGHTLTKLKVTKGKVAGIISRNCEDQFSLPLLLRDKKKKRNNAARVVTEREDERAAVVAAAR